ncbi:MAG: acyltransferase [Lachnospiraceae bacterium]|nr:acyltransferase [Lachnospiraceae bacterium]
MDLNRIKSIYHKVRFASIIDGCKRAEYLRKHHLLDHIGNNCMFQSRNFPMDPQLVRLHDNVTISAKVTFCTHDAIRHVLYFYDKGNYVPHQGCIEIEDNVFIGLGSIIMPDVHIGANSIIAAGSLVLNDVPSGTIVGGVPAKKIGTFNELHKKRVQEGEKLGAMSYHELTNYTWEQFHNRIKNAK